MEREGCDFTLTRRGVFMLAGGVGFAAWSRLYGSNSEFWNKKEPPEWTSAEIDQLISKSPWAKQVGAQYSHDRSDGSGYPDDQGQPGGGGGGRGGMGGGGPWAEYRVSAGQEWVAGEWVAAAAEADGAAGSLCNRSKGPFAGKAPNPYWTL